MARPDTIRFGKFAVLLGDGAEPEVFAAPCGFTERSLQLKADTSSNTVPDCDDPDAPAWDEKDITVMSATVSGQGVLAQAAHVTWREWFLSGLAKNVRVKFDLPSGSGGGYYEGSAVLTNFQMDSSFGEKVKISVTLESADAWTWVDAA